MVNSINNLCMPTDGIYIDPAHYFGITLTFEFFKNCGNNKFNLESLFGYIDVYLNKMNMIDRRETAISSAKNTYELLRKARQSKVFDDSYADHYYRLKTEPDYAINLVKSVHKGVLMNTIHNDNDLSIIIEIARSIKLDNSVQVDELLYHLVSKENQYIIDNLILKHKNPDINCPISDMIFRMAGISDF